jgi:hypothetical protein
MAGRRSIEAAPRAALEAHQPRIVSKAQKAPALVWQGAEYPRIEPGRYWVRGVKIQGPEWVRKYQRWSLRAEFALVHEPGNASAFFNMGNNPSGPHIGRQSRYWKAWTMANSGLPHRGQEMSPEVFLQGQFFQVSIEEATQDSSGKVKADAEVYSRITEFHSVEWP